jgi:hypothetical protein
VLARSAAKFAERFDAANSVERAVRVGSVRIASGSLRAFLIEAVEQGHARSCCCGLWVAVGCLLDQARLELFELLSVFPPQLFEQPPGRQRFLLIDV